MMKFNLRQACLLEASGELSTSSRKELFDQISQDPAARQEYERIQAELELLRTLPFHEASAADRRWIPARIKRAIRRQLVQTLPAKESSRPLKLRSYAPVFIRSGAALVAAAIVLAFTLSMFQRSALARHDREQLARTNALIDRLTVATERISPYDQALSDVQASLRQLQTESPTLASVHDQAMSQLFDTLATVPTDVDDALQPDPWVSEVLGP